MLKIGNQKFYTYLLLNGKPLLDKEILVTKSLKLYTYTMFRKGDQIINIFNERYIDNLELEYEEIIIDYIEKQYELYFENMIALNNNYYGYHLEDSVFNFLETFIVDNCYIHTYLKRKCNNSKRLFDKMIKNIVINKDHYAMNLVIETNKIDDIKYENFINQLSKLIHGECNSDFKYNNYKFLKQYIPNLKINTLCYYYI